VHPDKAVFLAAFPGHISRPLQETETMSKIRFEWITGRRLIERWNLDLRELHILIQNGLPVYNPNYELENRGPIYNETPIFGPL